MSGTNEGVAVLAFAIVARLLIGCSANVHWYVNASPSGSNDCVPSSETDVFVAAVWSGPTFGIGGRLIGGGAAMLFVRSGSGWLLPVMAAVNWFGPVALTVADTAMSKEAQHGIEPIVQMPVAGSYVPMPVRMLPFVYPAGRLNCAVTPFALLGPRFLTVTKKSTFEPTAALVGALKNEICRSAFGVGLTFAVTELLDGSGSGAGLCVTVAVRSYGPLAFTVADTAMSKEGQHGR